VAAVVDIITILPAAPAAQVAVEHQALVVLAHLAKDFQVELAPMVMAVVVAAVLDQQVEIVQRLLKLVEMAAPAQFLALLDHQFNMQVAVVVDQLTIHPYMHLVVLVLPAGEMVLVLLLLDIMQPVLMDFTD
jgi:hypothetical protein